MKTNRINKKQSIKFIVSNHREKTIEEMAEFLCVSNFYVKNTMDKLRIKPIKSMYICKLEPEKKAKPKPKVKPKVKIKVKPKVKPKANKDLTKEQKEYIHKHCKTKPIIYIAKEIGSYPLKVSKYYHIKNIPIIFARKRGYKDEDIKFGKRNSAYKKNIDTRVKGKLKKEKARYFKSELNKILYEINKSNNEGYKFGE